MFGIRPKTELTEIAPGDFMVRDSSPVSEQLHRLSTGESWTLGACAVRSDPYRLPDEAIGIVIETVKKSPLHRTKIYAHQGQTAWTLFGYVNPNNQN